MTVMLPKRRYGDIIEAEDAREAFYRMLHDIPLGATVFAIKGQVITEEREES
jgi:hypothetical protein